MMGLISIITKYLFIKDEPEKADVILVPGNPYPEPMELAARLYLAGFAPKVVPSGSSWLFHRRKRGELAECDMLEGIAEKAGVPESALLRECGARHTLDNARLSRQILDEAGIAVRSAILCCQSFHARRCLKAYGRYFKGVRLLVCPVRTQGFGAEDWWKHPIGVYKVATELLKCTNLFFFLISFSRAKR
jgi:uncharacterized SAM-binding protein YcdF (DUF218 family)